VSAGDDLRAAMRAAGLDYAGPIMADGRLRRFKTEGDHARNSWYVLHPGPPTAGAFGCWKRSIKETWCERKGSLSRAEWNEVRRRWQEAECERERAEKERRDKAWKTAAWILKRAKPLTIHAYLAAKGVKGFGDVREWRGALVLPLREANGELHSLQFIGADGSKHFLSGGRVAGCSFTLADKPDGALVVCEGYATGVSVHEATALATVCALNCGNLLAVAKSFREKFQGREIIIAADNDAWTDGNPGLSKAQEAALAVGAKLAVPQFRDLTTKPTDFNDLHQLQGIDAVKARIEGAATPKETDDEVVQRLAALPALEYERQREAAARRLGCRTSLLDKLVDAQRPKAETVDGELQGRTLNLPDLELWPDAVNGTDALSEVAGTISRFVFLPGGKCAADALALWCAAAHAFDAFVCSPRLNIRSEHKGCGKTTLRDVLSLFVPRPLSAENLSVAILFRVIEAQRPTLLADEVDAWLRDNEELRGLLNAGHRRGGQALRCEGDNHKVRAFNVFSPAVLCGIGALPGTLHDRSIVIRLERAKRGEVRERFDSRRVDREKELCRKLTRFAADHRAGLQHCDPALPPSAFNRIADNWRPLFAVAEVAGGDWPRRAAEAFAKLTAKEDTDAQGIGTMLLTDSHRSAPYTCFTESSIALRSHRT
jgi:putative DNA primase/helicase